MPVRRSLAAAGAAVALAGGSLALAPAAQADSTGHSTAVVLRAGLDVSLLNKTINVPLHTSLDDVQAPADARQTTLSAQLNGVDDGRPFNILDAKVATSRATADSQSAQGYSNLVDAQVHLPGLQDTPLLLVKQATSTATCEAGRQPTADSNLLGDIDVLGQQVALRAGGSTTVNVPGVGEVALDLSKTSTTTDTAAATALHLHLSVNPGRLNVAKVVGDITLVQATCETPGGGSSAGSTGGSTSGSSAGSTSGATGGSSAGSTSGSTSGSSAGSTGGATSGSSAGTQTGPGGHLAETGASSATPYLIGTAGALVVGGGAVVYVTRRRRKPAGV